MCIGEKMELKEVISNLIDSGMPLTFIKKDEMSEGDEKKIIDAIVTIRDESGVTTWKNGLKVIVEAPKNECDAILREMMSNRRMTGHLDWVLSEIRGRRKNSPIMIYVLCVDTLPDEAIDFLAEISTLPTFSWRIFIVSNCKIPIELRDFSCTVEVM